MVPCRLLSNRAPVRGLTLGDGIKVSSYVDPILDSLGASFGREGSPLLPMHLLLATPEKEGAALSALQVATLGRPSLQKGWTRTPRAWVSRGGCPLFYGSASACTPLRCGQLASVWLGRKR